MGPWPAHLPTDAVLPVNALLQALRGLLRRITGVLRRVGHVVVAVTAAGVARIRDAARSAGSRHLDRWADDGTYRRTLAAALVAIGTTLLPHAAVAAALAALVAEVTTTGYRTSRPSWDDEDDDPYSPRWSNSHAGSTSRPGYVRGRLWDDLE